MGGSSATLTQAEPRLSNIRVQTSSQGITLAKGWGRYRTSCNLIWYGNFNAIEHRDVQEQGGKGGGGGGITTVNISYTYEAAVIVALGHGLVREVISAWKGKERIFGGNAPERLGQRSFTTSVADQVMTNNRWQYYNDFAPAQNANDVVHTVSLPEGGAVRSILRIVRTSYLDSDYGYRSSWDELRAGIEYTQSGATVQFRRQAGAGDYTIEYTVMEAPAGWVSASSQLGLTLAPGLVNQGTWGWLQSNHPDQALAYPRMAYLYSANYALTNAAELHNHNFELSTGSELGVLPGRSEHVPDADPRVIIEEVIREQTWGVGWRGLNIVGLGRYSDYCVAHGFWLSPVLEEQTSASALLEGLLQLTNTNVVFDGQDMTFVPLGDADRTANGRTFVADTAPLVDLTADHFLCEPGQAPIKIKRHHGQDGSDELATGDDVGFNIWTLEIENRANGYTTEPVSYEDTAHILQHGRRQKPTIKAKAIKDASIGVAVASLLCQRELGNRNTYEFRLPWTMGFLKPLDLVTINDDTFALVRKPVRLLTVDESGDDFVVSAEDAEVGTASAPAYGTQASVGFAHDYNAAPGNVASPLMFEPPVELATATGLEVWVAVTGTSAIWGGCEVWASMDGGTTYKRMGEARGGARYGITTASLTLDSTSALNVALAGRGGQMLSASAQDASNLASLVYVRSANGPEYMAHQAATLTGTNAYTLAGLVRAGYDTKRVVHAAGSAVVRVDDLIVKSEPLPLSMIGAVLKFKFLSYNVFGGGVQALEDVPEYSYTVTGDMARLPPRNVASFTLTTQGDGTRVFSWAWGSIVPPADLLGYEVRYRQGTWTNWDDLLPFVTDDGYHTASPIETNQLLAGDYTFAIKTMDRLRVRAANALFISGRLPDPRLGNALIYRQLHIEGWPGTKTDCVTEVSGGALVLRARDQAVWAGGASNIPNTWAAWTRWVWNPVSSFVYLPPQEDFGASVSVLPTMNAQTNGTTVFEEQHSDNGTTWSAWAAVAGVVQARYVRTRITVNLPAGSPTGPGVTPVLVVNSLTLAYIGRVDKEYGNDVNPAGLVSPYRIGTGHFRLPTGKTWAFYSRIGLVLQNVGAGWTWELVDKNLTLGPAVKTYNASNVLADPPLIDFDIEGIVQ